MDWLVAVGVGLVALWVLLIAALWLLRPRDLALREVVGVVPDVLRLVRDLLRDPTVPRSARASLLVLLVWLVSPIDLIPEFIPVLGPLDDAVVAIVVLRFVRSRLGEAELRRRWAGTPAGWSLLARLLGGAASP